MKVKNMSFLTIIVLAVSIIALMGKPMTPAILAERGFTIEDFSNLGVKRQAAFPEMKKTCGGESL